MALHKDLTGAELHEPKGIETAAAGTVYVSTGSGSGEWLDRSSDNLILNRYWLNKTIPDVSTPSSSAFFYVPVKSTIVSLSGILRGPITTANDVLTIYIGGVPFADTLTVTFAGSAAGSAFNLNTSTSNTVPAGTIVEVRSNGASDTTAELEVQLGLKAIP